MRSNTITTTPGRSLSGWGRRIAFKLIAVVLSLVLLVTGARLLISGWFDPKDGGIHRFQDLAWGVIEGVILLAGIAGQLRRPARHAAALQQALLGIAALIATMALTLKVDPPTIVAGVLLLLLVGLHPARSEVLRFDREPDTPRLAIALLGGIPLLVFAFHQASLMRTTAASNPLAQTSGFAGACAAAIGVTLVALLAAVRRENRLAAWSAAAGALVLGIGSVVFPHHASSLGAPGGAAAIAGAALFVMAILRRQRWSTERLPSATWKHQRQARPGPSGQHAAQAPPSDTSWTTAKADARSD